MLAGIYWHLSSVYQLWFWRYLLSAGLQLHPQLFFLPLPLSEEQTQVLDRFLPFVCTAPVNSLRFCLLRKDTDQGSCQAALFHQEFEKEVCLPLSPSI